MAIALIFAGGTGKRMNSAATPKQFLPMHGKPVIVYTLEHFQEHDEIMVWTRCKASSRAAVRGMIPFIWGWRI